MGGGQVAGRIPVKRCAQRGALEGSRVVIVDDKHRRPAGVDDATVAAAGKASEALEWLERARGRLYDFHQMIGHLDFQIRDAAAMLREAGHSQLAELLESEVVGRNLLDGRWTFQIIEEFEGFNYTPIRAIEQRIRAELMDGRRHVFQAEMKERGPNSEPCWARGKPLGA